MKEWYCAIQGRQYGPITEDVLRAWIREGRVTAVDLVWSEGMAQWSPAGAVLGEMFAPGGEAPIPPSALKGLVPAVPPGGTGGATPNGELMTATSDRLRGNWGLPIGFSVLSFLLVAGAGIVPYVGGIAQLILQGPLILGATTFFLTFTRGQTGELGMLFIGFRNFGMALRAHLLMVLLIVAWALLFASVGIALLIAFFVMLASGTEMPMLLVGAIVMMLPGQIAAIVKQLAYSQTMYLIADDSGIGAVEAIRQSQELMRGRKLKLFWMRLLFGLLGILCVFTLFIGFVWLAPYMSTFNAKFHDDLLPPREAGLVGQSPVAAGL